MEWEQLNEALGGGTPVITANNRLAAEIRRRFDDAQAGRGLVAWPSPRVLPFGAWVQNWWDHATDLQATDPASAGHLAGGKDTSVPRSLLPVPLTLRQASWVWERTGRSLEEARGLLFPGGTALRAYEAWERLQAWRLPTPTPDNGTGAYDSPEEALFARWAEAYARTLNESGWIDPHQQLEYLLPLLSAGVLPLPDKVFLAGFDDHPPIRQAVWEALKEAGTVLETIAFPALGTEAKRVGYPDAESEAWAAARWARLHLERDPKARIGIVVPNLPDRRPKLARVFADVMAPAALLGEPSEGALPFNISSPPSLAEYPLVATAMALLALTPARQPVALWRQLLHSPFLGGGESEAEARAVFDLALRKLDTAFSPGAVARLAEGGEGERAQPGAPGLVRLLAQWRRVHEHESLHDRTTRKHPSGWLQVFSSLLDAWGWPGERSLDSTEFQTLGKWNEVLEEFARTGPFVGEIGLTDARVLLERMLEEEAFQPEGGEVQVQILGILEAGGLAFDHLWVLGLHHEAWPPGPRPNPFLPLALQRRHNMPHASVTRETELARRITERMLASAPDIVVSHPLLDEESELGPSPLVEHLPEVVPGALPASDIPELRRVIAAAGGTESFLDFQGPGLEEGATPRGGTAVFRDQAACPFRAFATHRLNARPIQEAVDGLDAADRGNLVHRVLDLAWERLGDHASLAALAAQGGKALDDFCGAVVDAALGEWFDQGNPMEKLRALEQVRVTALLRDWLLTELERPPFVVESRETKRVCTLGGITVTGRVDRIDRMPDGRRIVLDYKTGRVSLGEWFGERPDQPQLPIYCASEAVPPAGVAFARVRTGEFALVGLADDPALFPGARPIHKQFPDETHEGQKEANAPARLQALWAEPLHRLGEAFRTGDARVDPKKYPASCAYCGLDALCRIAESAGANGEDGEMTGERDD